MAVIFSVKSTISPQASYLINDAAAGLNGLGNIDNISNNLQVLINNVTITATGLPINSESGPFSVPYFVVYSHNSGGFGTGALTNLATGQIYIYPLTFTGAFVAAGDGMLYVGNRGAARSWYGWIAAISYSSTFLNTNQCVQWAQDPWSLWYGSSLDLSMLINTPIQPPPPVQSSTV